MGKDDRGIIRKLQPVTRVGRTDDLEVIDTCANCDRKIGKLETPHLWKENVVCGDCLPRLRGQVVSGHAAPASSPVPVQAMPQPVVVNNIITNNNVAGYAPRPRWSRGVAVILSMFIPGLGQMYKGQVLNGLVWLCLTVVGYYCLVVPGLVLHLCCILGAGMGDNYR